MCQVPLGKRVKHWTSEAFASGSIPWTHTPGTLDVTTCICQEVPFCTNGFIPILPVMQTEWQPHSYLQNNSFVTRHPAIGPTQNKHFAILYAPLHTQLQLPTPPSQHLLWLWLGQQHSHGWRFLNSSSVPLSCCIISGSPPILTRASALYSITFTFSFWPKVANQDKLLVQLEAKEYVDHWLSTLCFRGCL